MTPDALYELLPALYRWRDDAQGHALRDLLRVVGEQGQLIEDDIAQRYDDWFIETADDWVVPYLADLIGYSAVADAGLAPDRASGRDVELLSVLVPRRDVANTLRHRRRKGTLALLEELAEDVAGWPARAVETSRLLGWTQALNHQRPTRGRTVGIRAVDPLDRIDGPFDEMAHTIDVRRINSHRTVGRFNLPEIALFVWRLRVHSVTGSPAGLAEQAGRNCFTFSILGNDAPLFVHRDPEPDDFHLATEINVPGNIRRALLATSRDVLYGAGRSLAIWAPGWPRAGSPQPVPAEQIEVADLDGWTYRPRPNTILVDPVRGRLMFPARSVPKGGVRVLYHSGFSADIGGGEYDRSLVQASAWAAARVAAADIHDAGALVERLRSGDPLADALSAMLSDDDRAAVAAWDQPSGAVPAELVDVVVRVLDASVGSTDLFTGDRFPDAPGDLVVAALERSGGLRGALVNRRLLEHAFGGALATSSWRRRVATTAELRDALDQWRLEAPRAAVIELTATDVYSAPIELELAEGQSLTLRAAPRTRPVVWLVDRDAGGPDSLAVRMGRRSRLTLDGLLVTGRAVHIAGVPADVPPIEVVPVEGPAAEQYATSESAAAASVPGANACPEGQRVVIRHCTLVPGWTIRHDCEPVSPNEPSLELVDLGGGCVVVEHSILGSIDVSADDGAADPVQLQLADSILDATDSDRTAIRGAGGAVAFADVAIARCTVFGIVVAHQLNLAENSIFTGRLTIARRQVGFVRFCSLPAGSRTPRRHACQPDLVEAALRSAAAAAAGTSGPTVVVPEVIDRDRVRVRPQFTSDRYGRPEYAQLSSNVAVEIARGSDDESELGAFHDLYQPQRAANLAVRLDEYTVADMNAGIVFVTSGETDAR